MERRKNYYQAITRNLLIAFFCLSVLPIIGFALIMKNSVEETNVKKLGETAEKTVTHRGEVISQFLHEKENILNMLVGIFPEEQMFDQRNIERFFPVMASRGDIVDLQVIDSAGRQHAYVGPYGERSWAKYRSYAA